MPGFSEFKSFENKRLAELSQPGQTRLTKKTMAKRQERPERLSSNFLTVAIVLIVLFCLPSALALIFASPNLESGGRMTLIAFLVLFPVIGFAVSLWLILRLARKVAVGENDNLINWRIMRPENQRRKLNAEVLEIAETLTATPEQLTDLRSAYIVAEDLALRRIEQESKTSLLRHVVIETAEFDAVLVNEDVVKCIEVVFLVNPNVSQQKINVILRKVGFVKKLFDKTRPGTKLILQLLLITQFDSESELQLRSTVSSQLSATPVDVDIRIFDFEELQKTFAEG